MSLRSRVLVADDEPTARLLMDSTLRKAGFEVALAIDGDDALLQFKIQPCDIVLLDVDMPHLNGFETCASLRQLVGNELPIIMVTGMDDLASIERAYEFGATDFMSKPINWALLGHRVRYSLRSHQILRDLNRANARNAAILDALPDTLFRLDNYGRVLSTGATTGRTNDTVAINQPLSKSYPAPVANLICNSMENARQSGTVQEVGFMLGDDKSQQRHFEARIAGIDEHEALCLVRDITDQKKAEVTMRDSEALLQQAQAVARLGSWYLEPATRSIIWSREMYRIYHIPETTPPSYEAIIKRTHPDDLGALQEAWENSLTGKPYEYEHRIIVDGQIHWVRVCAEFEFNTDGTLARCVGTSQDVTERKVQELLVLSTQSRLQATLDAIPDLMFEMDSDGQYLDYHFPTYVTYEKFPGEIIGNTVTSRLPAEAAAVFMAALKEAAENGYSNGRQLTLPRADTTVWFELSVARKADTQAEGQRFVVLAREITERKEAEARIHDLAYFDSLTRLPSRLSFLERLDREVKRAAVKGDKLGVLFLDLDGFKNINDTLGHTIGDLALQEVAERLRLGLRPSDMLSRGAASEPNVSLARLGGDEFTVLMLSLNKPEDAMLVAERIKELLLRPFHLEGQDLMITASIGIAIFPEDGQSGAALLKHADSAMYCAKDEGRDGYQFYRASMTQNAVERMNMDTHLRLALEREEFFLVYQPQYDPASGAIHSVEALIRWNHPEKGLIAPAEFIPRIEANGLIVPIGEWALRTACRDVMSWQRHSNKLKVAVNLSPMQFRNSSLLSTIKTILTETGLPPTRLELEVTEGGLMECNEANLQTLYALQDTGITIALDDFGTGYSSMSYLKRLPLNHIKVDQSFISGLPGSKDSLAIVRAIISLAKNLDFTVTAEGVETVEQALLLKDMQCDKLQGFYFSEPVLASVIPALLNRRWDIESMTSLLDQGDKTDVGARLWLHR
jgi:diguanylate cyclase (GGDEF)-like protein/PAS domain S-box-containing protein